MAKRIHEPVGFRQVLRRERARADRGGNPFAVVVFDLASNAERGKGARRISSHIQGGMREVDEIGWLTPGMIGVLLPATEHDGAHRFAERVCSSLPDRGATPSCTVYEYPARDGAAQGSALCDTLGEPAPGHSPPDDGAGPEAHELRSLIETRLPRWKRGLDVAGALLMLAALAPVLLALAAYIKSVSRGPVFFRQLRVGRHGKLFTFIKFRTMKTDNDQGFHRDHIVEAIRADRPLAKLDDRGDARIIPGGRVLRKACLDELPQLFNVLRGEMSLVGPRPCLPYEADEFLRWHAHRFEALPGMTGLWQVSGKNKLTFNQMLRLDISYTEHMSLARDLLIILRTIPAILVMVAEAAAKRFAAADDRGPAVETPAEESAGS